MNPRCLPNLSRTFLPLPTLGAAKAACGLPASEPAANHSPREAKPAAPVLSSAWRDTGPLPRCPWDMVGVTILEEDGGVVNPSQPARVVRLAKCVRVQRLRVSAAVGGLDCSHVRSVTAAVVMALVAHGNM